MISSSSFPCQSPIAMKLVNHVLYVACQSAPSPYTQTVIRFTPSKTALYIYLCIEHVRTYSYVYDACVFMYFFMSFVFQHSRQFGI